MFPLHPHDPPSVGPYRLHARLGEDAYARVYLGSAHGEDPVAVKVVRAEYAVDPHFRSAFARLVEDARHRESRYVCRVRDSDTAGAVPWAAVARPLGPDLAELVREHGPLPVDALRTLALALALGLADLHAAGYAHGSLWPEGVVLSPDSALLADPGLEWAVADLGQRAPHPSFAAPEGGAGPATDVFSWAATVSFAASGVEGAPGLPRVPLQLRGLVEACLRRGPLLRPSSADLVRMLGDQAPSEPGSWPPEVLARVRETAGRQRRAVESADAEPATADAEATETRGEGGGGPSPSQRRGRRGRGLALAAAGAALALVAGGSVWWYGSPDGEETEVVEGPGMITDAACGDGIAYPAPEEEADAESVSAWRTAFSPDGELLAVSSTDAGLMLWDWREGEEVARIPEATVTEVDPVFAPVGCMVAAAVPTEYEGQEYPVSVATTFDLPSGTTTPFLGPQRGPTRDGDWPAAPRDAEHVSFSPDGSLLGVTLEMYGNSGGGNVGVVDTRTGEQTGAVAPTLAYGTAFPDSERVVTNDGGTLTVWDARTGEELDSVRGISHSRVEVVPGTDEVLYLDGDRIVWWDYVERTEVSSFRVPGFADAEEPYYMGAVLSSDRSRLYASWFEFEAGFGSEALHTNHVWDVETGEELLDGEEEAVTFWQVSVHPEDEVLAVITPEERVVMVDPLTMEPLGPPLF